MKLKQLLIIIPVSLVLGTVVGLTVSHFLFPGEPVLSFTPPNAEELRIAIGSIGQLPPELKTALDPADDFQPVPSPGPYDWLGNNLEFGQTYQQFLESTPNRPDSKRDRIYIQPLGIFEAGKSPDVGKLKDFALRFFMMPVSVSDLTEPGESPFTRRQHPDMGHSQLLTTDVLVWLMKNLPDDAYFVLAVTMEDLYPGPEWNFAFGQGSFKERAGVFSFARYSPGFPDMSGKIGDEALLLQRSIKVLAHESGHMFGMAHCIYFHCLMNGSNNLEESDARPLHFCPVCLRKLHDSKGFNILQRYSDLQAFHEQVGMNAEAEWLRHRIQHLKTPVSP